MYVSLTFKICVNLSIPKIPLISLPRSSLSRQTVSDMKWQGTPVTLSPSHCRHREHLPVFVFHQKNTRIFIPLLLEFYKIYMDLIFKSWFLNFGLLAKYFNAVKSLAIFCRRSRMCDAGSTQNLQSLNNGTRSFRLTRDSVREEDTITDNNIEKKTIKLDILWVIEALCVIFS